MRFHTVMFDLDGTLTDPRIGITRCIQYGLAQLGIVVDDPDTLTPYIGPPLLDSFPKLHGLTAEESLLALQHYRERFATTGLYENELYDGIPELLADLRGSGVTIIMATSKPTVFAEQIARHFAIDHHFEFIAGSNLDNTRVAKGEVIAHALTERPHLAREGMVMVGDRVHDVIGARANGLGAVGVRYGYGQPGELEESGADAVLTTVQDLAAFLLNG